MTQRGRNAAISTLAIALVTLAGCDQSDDVGVAVTDARSELASLSPSGSTAAPGQLRERVYGEVARDLEAAARDASGTGGPALVLAAQARAGEAQVAHHAMRSAQAILANETAEIQSELGGLLKYQAMASAAEGYDPSADRAQVRAQIDALNVELAQLTAQRQTLTNEVNGLTTQADTLAEQARETRNRAADLRNQAERLRGEQRLELISNAVETGREADGLEREADELRAEANNKSPQLDVLDRQRQRVESQLASANTTNTRLDEISAARREQARTARASAVAASERVSGRIEALMSTLEGEFAAHHEAAASAYDAAIGALSRAGSAGSRDESRATTGVMAHAALIVERDALGALRNAVQTLAIAADAGIGGDALARVNAMIDSATQRGADLIDRAQSALTGSGVRDASAEGLNRLAEKLEKLKPEFGIEAPANEQGDENAGF